MVDGPDRFQKRVGTTIREKWHVDAFLSSGSMAAVYAGTHRNGMRGALKILHKHWSRDPSLIKRFLREAYLANKVNHPSALRVLDDDVTEDGATFLVMELLGGETLESRRQRFGRLPLAEVLSIGDQLLDVLASAHAAGVVHRDLKPENVLLLANGTIKVLDFGIAQVWDGMRSSDLTETGTILGSPSYMPPEQARGARDEIDTRTDIWAAGATLFTLLSGQHVHAGESTAAKLLAAASNPARSLRFAAPDLPHAVVSVIDRALAFERSERWPDALAMREALRWARVGAGGSPAVGESSIAPSADATATGFDVAAVEARSRQLGAEGAAMPRAAEAPQFASASPARRDSRESDPTIRRESVWPNSEGRVPAPYNSPPRPFEAPAPTGPTAPTGPVAPIAPPAPPPPQAPLAFAPSSRRPRVLGFVLGGAALLLTVGLGATFALRSYLFPVAHDAPASEPSRPVSPPSLTSALSSGTLPVASSAPPSAPSSPSSASSADPLGALRLETNDVPAPSAAPSGKIPTVTPTASPTVSPRSLPAAPAPNRPRRPRSPAHDAGAAGSRTDPPLPNFPIPPPDPAPALPRAPDAP